MFCLLVFVGLKGIIPYVILSSFQKV